MHSYRVESVSRGDSLDFVVSENKEWDGKHNDDCQEDMEMNVKDEYDLEVIEDVRNVLVISDERHWGRVSHVYL